MSYMKRKLINFELKRIAWEWYCSLVPNDQINYFLFERLWDFTGKIHRSSPLPVYTVNQLQQFVEEDKK